MKGQNRPVRIQERIDITLLEDLKEIRLKRLKNGLEDDLIPIGEITRMIPNTEHWEFTKKELETKPRRKNE